MYDVTYIRNVYLKTNKTIAVFIQQIMPCMGEVPNQD